MRTVFALMTLSGVGALSALAQTMTPAPVLQIIRETNKEGREAAHEKIETEWASAARKAKHPARYVGFASISGPSEYWFVEPMASFGAFEDWDKASSTEPYKTTSANLNARDGDVRASSRTYWAVYRPELSVHPEKFNPARVKFVVVDTYHVKQGRDEDFAAATKQIVEGFHKGNVEACTLTYQVVDGAPSGTYFIFDMLESMKALDGFPARMKAMSDAMGPENLSRFMRSTGDLFTSSDSTILQTKPGMSYPPQEMVDADPGFWKPKAAMPAPAKKSTQH